MIDKHFELINELFNIGCVKFGEFTLKSGIKSPIYFDLRLIVSYPKILKLVSETFLKKIESDNIEFDLLCGVPYGAISLATSISLSTQKSMIFKRKDVKAHGTKNMVEGFYNRNDICLLIDDVITSGISIMETVEGLRGNGIKVTDALVLLDREQGGLNNILAHGIKLHSILKTNDVIQVLHDNNKITKQIHDKTVEFLNSHNNIAIQNELPLSNHQLDFEARAKLCKNKVGKKLFEIMSLKQSNLCVAVDFHSFDQLIKTAEEIGPHICILKIHIDIVDDFDINKMQLLKDLSLKYNFLIFEDRKFADIGNTVKSQYSRGIYKISQWSDIVNAHSLAGPGCIEGLKQVENVSDRACLLIAQLSSKDNLIDEDYVRETVKIAEENTDFIIGFICQKKISDNPSLLHISPGIQINNKTKMSDSLGQQYTTPEMSILDQKCDIIVVGRGITESENIIEATIKYKKAAFNSYLKRINL